MKRKYITPNTIYFEIEFNEYSLMTSSVGFDKNGTSGQSIDNENEFETRRQVDNIWDNWEE